MKTFSGQRYLGIPCLTYRLGVKQKSLNKEAIANCYKIKPCYERQSNTERQCWKWPVTKQQPVSGKIDSVTSEQHDALNMVCKTSYKEMQLIDVICL